MKAQDHIQKKKTFVIPLLCSTPEITCNSLHEQISTIFSIFGKRFDCKKNIPMMKT